MKAVRCWLAAVLIVAFAPAWSAATLTGIVVLNRERGTPMTNVEVHAEGANAVTTGNKGVFSLSLPEGRPGQDVRVRVRRSGWEVVNHILLDHRLPEGASARPLEIIICRGAEREHWVAEFYHLKGSQAVEQSYRAKLAELEGRRAPSSQERDRLLREREQALSQVQEWSLQSADLKPDEVRGPYREALRNFLVGETDAALSLLSEERLGQEAKGAQKQLNQAVQGWLLRGLLLSTKFDFDGASRADEQAVKLAQGSYDFWFRRGYFHQELNHFMQARRAYERALTLARQAADDSRVALTLNNLGLLSRHENRQTEARKQYEEALEIRRSLAKKNPDLYLPEVASTLANLGVLNSEENRKADAHRKYEEALDLYRSLAKKSPDVYLSSVAATLNNLGLLSREENRQAEARKHYEEALDLYRSLAKLKPDFYRPSVATTLNNLGMVSSDQNRRGDARRQYEEALDFYRSLAKKNPAVYLPDVAMTLNNLGALNSGENRKAEARRQYEEALGIRRSLAKKNPDVYLPKVAATLNNLGLLSRDQDRKAEARKQYEEALDIYRRFATREPATYAPSVRLVESNILALIQ